MTERQMVHKLPSGWMTGDTARADDFESVLDEITKAPPGQAKGLAQTALNKHHRKGKKNNGKS